MNLEAIEQYTLRRLEKTENPLLPVSDLLTELRRLPGNHTLAHKDLMDFLSRHELFRVVASPYPGIGSELVLLYSRVPSEMDYGRVMADQLMALITALEQGIEELEDPNGARAGAMLTLLSRAYALQDRLSGASAPDEANT